MKALFSLLLLLLTCGVSFSQTLTEEESRLYDLIMAYRQENGLPAIPLSASLTFVAQTHVQDLAINKPDLGDCNAHSWSDQGEWSACCYTPDHSQSACMWEKPRELTGYQGKGFEIASGSNDCCEGFVMTADYAIGSWKKSKGHNAVIINDGKWTEPWNAIGIGLYESFAVVWFGRDAEE